MNRFLHFFLVPFLVALPHPGICSDVAGADAKASPDAAATAHGVGVVRKVDMERGRVTLDHQPIRELGWPAMRMDFQVADPALLKGLAPGQAVRFDLRQGRLSPVITSIQPAP